MIFHSFDFIFIFLPIALFLYYSTGLFRKSNLSMAILVLCSLAFYGYGNLTSLLVFIPSMITNFAFGLLLRKRRGKGLLGLAIAANLGVLGYFKYTNFLIANISPLMPSPLAPLNIILPVGISFFTFQQIAYLVDIYLGKIEDTHFIRYLLFVSFFPKVTMGPITRHGEMLRQFVPEDGIGRLNLNNFSLGLMWFTMGLAKKVLIADQCAPWANAVFDHYGTIGLAEAWIGALAYTMQLYFDFSGYSDMAIGIAKFFNIQIPQNFLSPYKATSIADFWRRWHITLSLFLRDYIYIPLGGNRAGRFRRSTNVMVTMLLAGLWHGANWTFVVWGGYHGLLIVLNHAWSSLGRRLPPVFARGFTFIAVLVGWVFFRSQSINHAFEILKSMVDVHSLGTGAFALIPGGFYEVAFLLLLLVFVNIAPNTTAFLTEQRMGKRFASAFAALFFICILSMNQDVLTKVPAVFLYRNF